MERSGSPKSESALAQACLGRLNQPQPCHGLGSRSNPSQRRGPSVSQAARALSPARVDPGPQTVTAGLTIRVSPSGLLSIRVSPSGRCRLPGHLWVRPTKPGWHLGLVQPVPCLSSQSRSRSQSESSRSESLGFVSGRLSQAFKVGFSTGGLVSGRSSPSGSPPGGRGGRALSLKSDDQPGPSLGSAESPDSARTAGGPCGASTSPESARALSRVAGPWPARESTRVAAASAAVPTSGLGLVSGRKTESQAARARPLVSLT